MKVGEVKLRLSNTVLTLIDTYFGDKSIVEKFINSTLKILLKQNIHKVDGMISLFADENGDVKMEEIINEYANIIDESGYVFNIKDYVKDETVKNLIPDKILVIKREDILKMLV